MMREIFEQIEKIGVNSPQKKLIVHKKTGTKRANILAIANKFGFKLSEDYLAFMEYSNGMCFFEYFDCQIYDYKEAFELSKINEENFKNGLLLIGSFYDIYEIYMNCKNSDGDILVSLEGIADPVALELNFKQFMQKCIDCKFKPFWDDDCICE